MIKKKPGGKKKKLVFYKIKKKFSICLGFGDFKLNKRDIVRNEQRWDRLGHVATLS